MKPRNIAAAVAMASALWSGGLVIGAHAAHAGAPVYETRTAVETVSANGKCLVTRTHTVRPMQWSTKAGHYVNLVTPAVTNSASTRCHA